MYAHMSTLELVIRAISLSSSLLAIYWVAHDRRKRTRLAAMAERLEESDAR
jgi:hypothetical protein